MSRSESTEHLPLSKATELLLEECRMILPGMQALFGFELVAVFNAGFHERLGAIERDLHLVAVALTVVAIILIMTPAAFHRQVHPHQATSMFVDVCTRLMLASMVPLAAAMTIEFYLVARVILDSALVPWLASAVFALCVFFWFVMPRLYRPR